LTSKKVGDQPTTVLIAGDDQAEAARKLVLDRLSPEQLHSLTELLGPAALALGPEGPFARPA
jgi:hypothetical protein